MKHNIVKKLLLALTIFYEIMLSCSATTGTIKIDNGNNNNNYSTWNIQLEKPTLLLSVDDDEEIIIPSSTTQRPKVLLNSIKVEHKYEIGAANITHLDISNRTKPHINFPAVKPRFEGPFFEEESELENVTARVGSTINLNCRIALLGDKTVTWSQKRNEYFNLLTVGKNTHSKDERFNLGFRYPNNYRLTISYITKRDDGLYECQVATHPPRVKKIYVKITAPEVKIVDESLREVHERYYRQGSLLLLTCLATNIDLTEDEKADDSSDIITWKQDDQPLDNYVSTNISEKNDSAISALMIEPLERNHSGNYSCLVKNLAEATVTVHVLYYGELPAAVQTTGVQVKSSNFALFLNLFILWMYKR